MTTGQREAAVSGLLRLLAALPLWKSPPSRHLKLWDDVPKPLRPVCFVFEGGNETRSNEMSGRGRTTLDVRLFVYFDTTADAVPATQLNVVADAIDAALAPAGADTMLGRNTLGGAAYWARIEGSTLKVPGDLDGDGILVVPVKITLP